MSDVDTKYLQQWDMFLPRNEEAYERICGLPRNIANAKTREGWTVVINTCFGLYKLLRLDMLQAFSTFDPNNIISKSEKIIELLPERSLSTVTLYSPVEPSPPGEFHATMKARTIGDILEPVITQVESGPLVLDDGLLERLLESATTPPKRAYDMARLFMTFVKVAQYELNQQTGYDKKLVDQLEGAEESAKLLLAASLRYGLGPEVDIDAIQDAVISELHTISFFIDNTFGATKSL